MGVGCVLRSRITLCRQRANLAGWSFRIPAAFVERFSKGRTLDNLVFESL